MGACVPGVAALYTHKQQQQQQQQQAAPPARVRLIYSTLSLPFLIVSIMSSWASILVVAAAAMLMLVGQVTAFMGPLPAAGKGMMGGSSANSQRQHVSRRVEGPLFFQVRIKAGAGIGKSLCLISTHPRSHFVNPSFAFQSDQQQQHQHQSSSSALWAKKNKESDVIEVRASKK